MTAPESSSASGPPLRVGARSAALRNTVLIAGSLLLIAILYYPSFATLAHNWVDFENLGYTHGWLIVVCVVWLIYDTASDAVPIRFNPSTRGALLLAALSVVWLLAFAANVQLVHQAMLPPLALASVFAMYGYAQARKYSFPFAYLYFAIGIWGVLNSPLQWGTIYAMRFLVRAIGIPAYFDGSLIELPSGPIAVEGGCSGLNFFVVAVAIAAFYAYINRIRKWPLLIAIAALFSIVTNWIRVLVIVIAGHVTNMQHYLITVEHIRFGWVVFAVMMFGLLFVASKMESVPAHGRTEPAAIEPTSIVRGLVLAAAALSLGPIWSFVSNTVLPKPAGELMKLPSQASMIERPSLASAWRPIFIGADSAGVLSFSFNDVKIESYEALYLSQSQAAKLAHYENSILGDLRLEAQEAPVDGMQQWIVRDKNDDRWLLRHAYFAGEHIYAKALTAQIVAGLTSLVRPTRAAVVAVKAKCGSDCTVARRALDELALSMGSVKSRVGE